MAQAKLAANMHPTNFGILQAWEKLMELTQNLYFPH